MESALLEVPLPDSTLPYPERFADRLKYYTWKVITPGFTRGQSLLLKARLIKHTGRQRHLIGYLAPGVKLEDFLRHLRANGWGNHFIAWKDDGQVVSVRKLASFAWQYHLRIFEDGEVRGHFERTPEAHPIRHLTKEGQVAKFEDMLKFTADFVIPVKGPVKRTQGRSRS